MVLGRPGNWAIPVATSLALLLSAPPVAPQAHTKVGAPDVRLFFQAVSRDDGEARAALEMLGDSWRDGYAGMLLDLARLLSGARRRQGGAAGPSEGLAPDDERPGGEAGARPGARDMDSQSPSFVAADPRRQRLIRFLEKQTGQRFG